MDVDENLTIPGIIENVYLETVHQTAEALKYLHAPTGPLKQRMLHLAIPFYELYQHTRHIPAVAEVMGNDPSKTAELDNWFFSPGYTPDALRCGIDLFSWYQKILLESRVITIERQ